MFRKWMQLSLLYLIIAGVLGCLLRMIFLMPLEGVNFRYVLHAHSHVAFQKSGASIPNWEPDIF